MGIRGQLALLVPGVVFVGLVGLAFAAAEYRRRDEMEDMRLRSVRVLEAVGVPVAVNVAENDMAGLDTLIAHMSQDGRYPDLIELSVLDDEARVLAHSMPERFNTLETDAFSATAVRSDGPVWRREGDRLRIAVPAMSGLRWATVTATFSLARLEAQVAAERMRWLFAAGGVSGLLALAMFLALDRLVVRPVRRLQRVARRMGEGDLDARVPALRGTELSELSETFNRMAAALKEQRETLERTVEQRTAELRQANQRLEKLAVTDGLTGVFNHRRFQEALAQEVLRSARNGRPMSVLMCDVDHFKRFNDSLGHPAGDELLRQLAAVLQGELRATDLLARYGGEEFAILLPETDKDEAVRVAERLRGAVESKLDPTERFGQKVSISIGVATWQVDGQGPQALLSAADRALYAAKSRGRNRVVAAGLGVA